MFEPKTYWEKRASLTEAFVEQLVRRWPSDQQEQIVPLRTKYQMEQEGYSLDDLEQAEKLSVKTGRKAIELAKAKGKHPKTGNGLMW
jgi:hypothetical protein